MTSERLFNSFIPSPPPKKKIYPKNKCLATPLAHTLNFRPNFKFLQWNFWGEHLSLLKCAISISGALKKFQGAAPRLFVIDIFQHHGRLYQSTPCSAAYWTKLLLQVGCFSFQFHAVVNLRVVDIIFIACQSCSCWIGGVSVPASFTISICVTTTSMAGGGSLSLRVFDRYTVYLHSVMNHTV